MAGLSKREVAAVALPTVLVALVVNLALRAVAVGRFGVPAAALPLVAVVMPSVGAVLGPALGCYLAFRHSTPHSMRNFLLPGAGFTAMGIAIEVVRYAGDHGDLRALAFGVGHGLVAMGLALCVLLWLVARDR